MGSRTLCTVTAEPPHTERPKPSPASNAVSILWMVALAAFVVRATKRELLAKVHLAEAPLWWFIAAVVLLTAAWAAVERAARHRP